MAAPATRRARGAPAPALCAALAAFLLACGAPPPAQDWPPGALFSANAPALAALLDALAQLEGTPLARRAASLRAALPRCPELEASAPDLEGIFASLRCADPQGPLAAFHRERGAHDLAFALPGEPGARAIGHADLEAGAAQLALRFVALPEPWAALVPGDAPAGPDRLARAERVAHARARSAGPLDLAALVPPGSQGDRLFGLRDQLLSAALLDSSVELALYLPEPGASMPRSALALGVRQPEAAQAAAERFLDEIAARWRLRRAPFEADGRSGACLPDLHLLPELAPCYALAGDALVLGWNPQSLRHALASEAADPAAEPAAAGAASRDAAPDDLALPARLELDLAALRDADLRLAALAGGEARAQRWPWRRLRARAERRDGALELRLLLEPEPAS
jgi:hypothetical protein